MLYYNIHSKQADRPVPLAPVSRRRLSAAAAGSLGLHALAVAAVLTGLSAHRLPRDPGAAITVYVESDARPVARASESPSEAVPASEPGPVSTAEPPPEPRPVEAREEPLPDFVPPPPPEALAPPDFSPPPPPPPPPPKPPQAVTRPVPPKSVPKSVSQPDPRRAPAAVEPPAPASTALPPSGSVPGLAGAASGLASSAPATVAPGWNALLAAWLAANRRYPDESRRRSEEGEVTVRFTVASDGRVSEANLVKGSGFASLDAAALRLLQGATLPAPGIEATRIVRIRFRLGD